MSASAPRTLSIVRRTLSGQPRGWPDHVHPVLQRVYAARGVPGPEDAQTRLSGLLPPDSIHGIHAAAEWLTDAIARQSRIVIAADFDCDGACGAAIAVRGLRALGARQVGYVVPHRMVHGYGLSPALVETLQPAPDLIVTVDNGIASHAGVAAAKARGCKVIVTDHHLPGATLPQADAIVNPQLGTDALRKNLCGAGVMFYLLLALRARLREQGGCFCDHPDREDQNARIPERTFQQERSEPDLSSLLDLVALASVADMVALDRNNRILVEAGLRRIRAGRACAGIHALIEIAGCDPRRLAAEDFGYALAPRINAAGRLEDMTLGIECLLTDDPVRASELAAILHGINGQRRGLQEAMMAEAETMLARIEANACGVALFDPAWHPGVIGLVASKIKERLHRPVIAFAPDPEGESAPMEERAPGSALVDRRAREVRKGPDVLRGSARSIAGFHIRDALADIDAREPGLILRFGGHAMAAGLSLRAVDYARFAQCFDAIARERIAPESLQPLLHSDGELAPVDFDAELARQLRAAGPWGQGFPAPLFDNAFECTGWRRIGADQRHLRIHLRDPRDGRVHDALWFHADTEPPVGSAVRIAYELAIEEWRGVESLSLRVRGLWPEPQA
ncbi:MAG: DHH family phosphoesterase [Proteobacteria bacterium]|nr:DHH family phosphoesterase [Pseudomonadota bacterium]